MLRMNALQIPLIVFVMFHKTLKGLISHQEESALEKEKENNKLGMVSRSSSGKERAVGLDVGYP